MTPADLLALAERVEREEPSAELAVAVMRATNWTSEGNPLRSLDAVVRLVPAGWIVTDSTQYVTENGGTRWHHSLWSEQHDNERMVSGDAPTEPRARTAAALRARALAQEKNDGR